MELHAFAAVAVPGTVRVLADAVLFDVCHILKEDDGGYNGFAVSPGM